MFNRLFLDTKSYKGFSKIYVIKTAINMERTAPYISVETCSCLRLVLNIMQIMIGPCTMKIAIENFPKN